MVRVLERILSEMAESFERAVHSALCDSSCPDCLRSYDNRQLHSVLDWRLALDVADLAVGKPLSLARWVGRGRELTAAFVAGFRDALAIEAVEVAGLPAVLEAEGKRLAFFGHPLWRLDPRYYTEQQAEAEDSARAVFAAHEARAFDTYSLGREPYKVFAWLAPRGSR